MSPSLRESGTNRDLSKQDRRHLSLVAFQFLYKFQRLKKYSRNNYSMKKGRIVLQCKTGAGSYLTNTLFYTLNKDNIFNLGIDIVKIFRLKQKYKIDRITPPLRDWPISLFYKRDKCLIHGSWDTHMHGSNWSLKDIEFAWWSPFVF